MLLVVSMQTVQTLLDPSCVSAKLDTKEMEQIAQVVGIFYLTLTGIR